MTNKKLHFISGLTITIFIGMHLLNHLASVVGPETHIELMDKFRIVYRNRVGETILLLAVVVQIISGLKLYFSKSKAVSNHFEKLQIYSGLYLAFFLLIHVGAVLTGRYVLSLNTNFYFGVAGLNTFPLNLFFFPYYGLAIVAFFGHIAGIHFQKMEKNIFGLSVDNQSIIIIIIGLILTAIVLYGLTNGFAGFEIPREYDIIIGK